MYNITSNQSLRFFTQINQIFPLGCKHRRKIYIYSSQSKKGSVYDWRLTNLANRWTQRRPDAWCRTETSAPSPPSSNDSQLSSMYTSMFRTKTERKEFGTVWLVWIWRVQSLRDEYLQRASDEEVDIHHTNHTSFLGQGTRTKGSTIDESWGKREIFLQFALFCYLCLANFFLLLPTQIMWLLATWSSGPKWTWFGVWTRLTPHWAHSCAFVGPKIFLGHVWLQSAVNIRINDRWMHAIINK